MPPQLPATGEDSVEPLAASLRDAQAEFPRCEEDWGPILPRPLKSGRMRRVDKCLDCPPSELRSSGRLEIHARSSPSRVRMAGECETNNNQQNARQLRRLRLEQKWTYFRDSGCC